jgi:hypothetical protein
MCVCMYVCIIFIFVCVSRFIYNYTNIVFLKTVLSFVHESCSYLYLAYYIVISMKVNIYICIQMSVFVWVCVCVYNIYIYI